MKDSVNLFTVGGMRSKLKAIQISVGAGIPVFLADGRRPKVLEGLFGGKDIGTFFAPEKAKGQNRKSWIFHFVSHTRKR